MRESVHKSVLLQELIEGLSIAPEDVVFDGTVNGGGHAEAVTRLLGSEGVFLGTDLDQSALDRAGKRLSGATCRVVLRKENFRNVKRVLAEANVPKLTKAYFDLGLSSDELEHSGRGFSFQKDEPLLMTFDSDASGLTAREIVNEWQEESLADVIYGFGQERAARKIAKAIIEAREVSPIETSGQLSAIVSSVVRRRGKTHPATKTFQALRIATNDELGALKEVLGTCYESLESKGRIAVISFHSSEDRIVKDTFREWARLGKGRALTKKPIIPTKEEIKENPRSRSSKLRIFEKS